MADSIKIVRFTAGGSIEELLHIQSDVGFSVTNYGTERDSLEFAQGDRNQQMVKRGGRYGGEYYAGERLSNQTYKCKIVSEAPTADLLLQKLSDLIAECDREPGEHYIEHRMDGATYPSYYEVRAPATRSPIYSWAKAQAGVMVLDIAWPVAPLVCGPPMHALLNFGNAADVSELSMNAGSMDGMSSGGFSSDLTVERRFAHTGRGYEYGSHQVTVQGKPGATISGFKLGAELKAGDDTYIDCYVDDNGTNSRLRIDTVVGGSRTNRATTNLGARVSNGTDFWIRARIENNAITVDYFTSLPVPSSTPNATRTYSLTGGDATALGASVQGVGGASITPQHADARIMYVAITPYVYASKLLPTSLHIDGEVPGDAPAKGGITIAPVSTSGGSASAVFGMIGWSGGNNASPFGLYDSAAASALTDMANTVDAGIAHGGELAEDSSFDGACAIEWAIDLAQLFPDEASPATQAVEVWARVKTSSSMGVFNIVASSYTSGFTAPAMRRYTEFGATGKRIPIPPSDTIYQPVRLGTIILEKPAPGDAGLAYIKLDIVGTNSGGTVGVDWMALVGATRRAASPTGKDSLKGYPSFLNSHNTLAKTIRHDLSAIYSTGAQVGASTSAATHGLSGAMMEFAPGLLRLFMAMSRTVPDSPQIAAGTNPPDVVIYTVTFNPLIIPRWRYQRPS